MPDAATPLRRPDPGATRLVLTLSLAGLFSGIAIAGVHEMTRPRIQANKAASLRRAVFHVVPGADSMQVFGDGGDSNAAATTAETAVYVTWDAAGTPTGYAIAAEGPGFQDAIRLIFGYRPAEQRIVGMQVLESRETPGLGDKIIKDQAFLDNFTALDAAGTLALVPQGTRQRPHEVDAITGATISSRAVVRILNDALATWRSRLQEPPPGGAAP